MCVQLTLRWFSEERSNHRNCVGSCIFSVFAQLDSFPGGDAPRSGIYRNASVHLIDCYFYYPLLLFLIECIRLPLSSTHEHSMNTGFNKIVCYFTQSTFIEFLILCEWSYHSGNNTFHFKSQNNYRLSVDQSYC